MARGSWFKSLVRRIKRLWRLFDAINRHRATDILAWETAELENLFGLVVLGALVGLPTVPLPLSLELLPAMEEELHAMLQRVNGWGEPIATLYSLLGVE